MSRTRTVGLSAVFLLIAVFVSTSLVLTLRASYAIDGRAPAINDALHLLQKV